MVSPAANRPFLPTGPYPQGGPPSSASYEPRAGEYNLTTGLMMANPHTRGLAYNSDYDAWWESYRQRFATLSQLPSSLGEIGVISGIMNVGMKLSMPAILQGVARLGVTARIPLFLLSTTILSAVISGGMTLYQAARHGRIPGQTLGEQWATGFFYSLPSMLLGMGLMHRFGFGRLFLQDLALEPVQAVISTGVGKLLEAGSFTPEMRMTTWERVKMEFFEGVPFMAAGRLVGQGVDWGVDRLSRRQTQPVPAAELPRVLETAKEVPSHFVKAAIGFTDFAQFSTKTKGVSADRIGTRLDEYFEVMTQEIVRRGGIIDKYIGDAVMFYFVDYPDNAVRAVEAALAMQEVIKMLNARLRKEAMQSDDPLIFEARIGVDTGVVLHGSRGGKVKRDVTVIGDSVNAANRMESKAPVGGVLITKSVKEEIGEVFKTASQGEIEAKGIGKVEAFVVERRLPVWGRIRPEAERKVSFQGREDELKGLQEAFLSVEETGKPRFVLVEGKAGQGKSALADQLLLEWLQQHNRNTHVLIGRGREQPVKESYYVMRQALRDLAEIQDTDVLEMQQDKIRDLTRGTASDPTDIKSMELAEEVLADLLDVSLGPPSEIMKYLLSDVAELRKERVKTVLQVFQGLASREPVLFVIDDLQWVDQGTWKMTEAIMEDLPNSPIMVLSLARPDVKVEGQPDWFQGKFAATKLTLSSLPDRHLGSMVDEILPGTDPRVKEFLVRSANGHPFYLETTLLAIKNERWGVREIDPQTKVLGLFSPGDKHHVPRTAHDILQARLLRLPKREIGLLQKATIIGPDFDLDGLHALGISASKPLIDELIKKDLIVRVGEDRYKFQHDLIRGTAYDRMTADERQKLHTTYARYLAKHRSEALALIASHFERGGKPALASDSYSRAAEQAFKKGYLGSAATFYRRAYELARDPRKQFEILMGWDQALFVAGEFGAQAEVHTKASQLVGGLTEIDKATLLFRIGRWLNKCDDYHGSELKLLEVRKIIKGRAGRERLSFDITLALGRTYVGKGEYLKARETYEEALKSARLLGGAQDISRALVGIALVEARLGNHSEALKAVLEAGDVLKGIGDANAVIQLVSLGFLLMVLGDYQGSEKTLREANDLSMKFGGKVQGTAHLVPTLGRVIHLQGDPREAIRIHEGFLQGNPHHLNVVYQLVCLALAYADNNQLANAAKAADEALALARAKNNRDEEASAQMAVAQIYLKEGKAEEALEATGAAYQLFKDLGGIEEFDLEILLTHVKVLMQLGRDQEAWGYIDEAKKLIDTRASGISDPGHQKSFLTRVEVNREIKRIWPLLKEMTSKGLGESEKAFLQKFHVYPPEVLPKDVQFVSPARPGEISRVEREHADGAGTLLELPWTSVFTSLMRNVVTLAQNPSELRGVWGEEIRWEPFWGADESLYAVLDWKVAGKGEFHRVVLPYVGEPTQLREIMKADIYAVQGTLYIEFNRAPGTKVQKKTGADVEVDPEERPRKRQFGKIRIALTPTLDGKTILVLEMDRALYTQNPWNFLEPFVSGIIAGNGVR